MAKCAVKQKAGTCRPATFARCLTKDFFNMSPFMIKAMTPNACNPNLKAFGNVRAQVGGETQGNPRSTDVGEKQGFE